MLMFKVVEPPHGEKTVASWVTYMMGIPDITVKPDVLVAD